MKKAVKRPRPLRRPRFISSLGVALLLLAAVGVGLLLPELGSAIQERRTDRLVRTVELGQVSLSLTSDDSKLEKLRLVGEMINNQVEYMELENGRVLTPAKAADKLEDVLALLDGTGLSVNGLVKSDLVDASPMLMVTTSDSFSTNLVWGVQYGKMTDGGWTSLDYLVDDATGLILAASFRLEDAEELRPAGPAPDSSVQAQKLVQNLAGSYGFAETVMSIEGSARVGQSATMYTVNYTNSQGTVLGLPIIMGPDAWSINYYEGWYANGYMGQNAR